MVAMQTPLSNLDYGNEETAAYIGVLERQVLGLTMNEMKYRALLELATGEDWSDLAHDLEQGELDKIATAAIEKKLGVSNMEARKIVRQRKKAVADDQPAP